MEAPPDSALLRVMRVKLTSDQAAPQPDPLGRERIGYLAGADADELWERGRGVWTVDLDVIAKTDLLVLTYDDVVVAVGSVDGVTFHGAKIAIIGRPAERHPLLGVIDPLANRSHNPVKHGQVSTAPVEMPRR